MLEAAGLDLAYGRDRDQAAGVNDARGQARRRAYPDRGQAPVGKWTGAVAQRRRRVAGLSALYNAPGGAIRRMESARSHLHHAGFRRRVLAPWRVLACYAG